MDELLYLVLGHLGVLLLEMSDTVSFGGEPYVAAHTKEGLLGATAVGAEMVLQGTEKLEVFAAVFTHSVRRLEILCGAGRFCHIFVVSYGCIYFLFFIFAMLLSDVSFTVGFSGEGKVTNSALKWSFSIMSAEMSNQRALVSTGVAT